MQFNSLKIAVIGLSLVGIVAGTVVITAVLGALFIGMSFLLGELPEDPKGAIVSVLRFLVIPSLLLALLGAYQAFKLWRADIGQ